jgi:hypothetical protein
MQVVRETTPQKLDDNHKALISILAEMFVVDLLAGQNLPNASSLLIHKTTSKESANVEHQ